MATVGVALLLLAGCGRGGDGYRVSGTVSFRGKPLPRGIINFVGQDNRPLGGPILPDGSYQCRLAPGKYVVTVAAPVVAPPGWKDGDPMPEDELKLPPRYALRQSSGLSATVEEDPQTLDFELD